MRFSAYILFLWLFSWPVQALVVGDKAPDFSLKGDDGAFHSLSDFSEKIVVLEWLNHGCPFVKRHYDLNNMQRLQKRLRGKGAIWLSIISSAKGQQGYVDVQGAQKQKVQHRSQANVVLLDPEGEVGRTYGAKVTPHMYVIDSEGTLAYMGAIDGHATMDHSDPPPKNNYVQQAVESLLAGKKVVRSRARPYGCSVKYAAP